MNRFWLGLGILVLVLAVGLGVTFGLAAIQEPTAEALAKASALAQQERWPEAEALLQTARDRWQQAWHFSAAVTDHEPMEEIDALFSGLEVYQGEKNSQEFAANCAQLSRLVLALADAHRVSWWNFL